MGHQTVMLLFARAHNCSSSASFAWHQTVMLLFAPVHSNIPFSVEVLGIFQSFCFAPFSIVYLN
ncbi:MAG: hypothetical protein K1W34_22095, partial [Lachnospiraceae bacterium]